ncbi:alpha/beta hydrolase [Coralliovum pocilloporae]|uniref:alpha/beta hydrolase n=1 Tax=Coralliovum pocilloporae TaxID=3066369 RepID=UPI003306B600
MLILLSALVLSGCARGRPESGALLTSLHPDTGASLHTIFVASSRQRDERRGTYFNGERAEGLNFAQFHISVPPGHETDKIEWPSTYPGNPQEAFTVRAAGHLSTRDFSRNLIHDVQQGSGDILIFVHGYNTHFAEGLYRFTQIVHDSGFPGTALHFSWASRGEVPLYLYDLNSATAARNRLEKTIELAARHARGKVHIMAHSMGNWLLMETLRQSRLKGQDPFRGRRGAVVMAAPDIDLNVFMEQMKDIGKPESPILLIASGDDLPLQLSERLGGDVPRLGAYRDRDALAEQGLILLDLTDVDSADRSGHSAFAEISDILPRLARQARLVDGRTEDSGVGQNLVRVGSSLTDLVRNAASTVVPIPGLATP